MSHSFDRPAYRSPVPLAKLLSFAFVPYTAAIAYMAFMLLQGVFLADRISEMPVADVLAFSARFDELTIPSFVFYALGILSFGLWAHRAASNGVAFGEPVDSPGWTIGYFFVPILCLWRPLQSLSTLWIHSDPAGPADGDHWTQRAHRAPRFFTAWWITWMIARGAWLVTNVRTRSIKTPDDWATAMTLGVAASAFEITALVLMFAVVWSITRRQEQRHAASLPRAAMIS